MPALIAYFYISPGILWSLFIFVFAFSIYAQIKVSGAYCRNSKIQSRGGITGRDAAAAVMAHAGIHDVEIDETEGHLTDHYDPVQKKLVLVRELPRDQPRGGGVAAHEAGLTRSSTRKASGCSSSAWRWCAMRIASSVVPFIYLASFIFLRGLSGMILDVAIICFAILTLFQLVTLPVEFDASRRGTPSWSPSGSWTATRCPASTRSSMPPRSPTSPRSPARSSICSTCFPGAIERREPAAVQSRGYRA